MRQNPLTHPEKIPVECVATKILQLCLVRLLGTFMCFVPWFHGQERKNRSGFHYPWAVCCGDKMGHSSFSLVVTGLP